MKYKLSNNYQLKFDDQGEADVEILFYNELGNIEKHMDIFNALKDKNRLSSEITQISVIRDQIRDLIFVPVRLGINLDEWRKIIASISNICLEHKYKIIKFEVGDALDQLPMKDDLYRLITEIFVITQYRYTKCKSKQRERKLALCFNICNDSSEKYLREGLVLATGTVIARDLINTPSNLQTPKQLLEDIKNIFEGSNVIVRGIEQSEMKKLGMTGLLSVSKGSINEPVLIILEYQTDLTLPKVGIIGKGITYDSGGLSLKGKAGMITMHHDMAGAAAVVGALYSASSEGLQNNLIGVLPVAENLIATDGYRPGDIITMMSGKTVQILSTDAEGRLVIADALHYAITKENVQEVLDIASLTGGAKLAYGPVANAYAIDNVNVDMQNELQNASEMSGEKIWQMPLFDEYSEMLKTEHADMTNTGNGSKMIGGALFIKEFTSKLPWIHIDIAGTCWSKSVSKHHTVGATGSGVRLLYHYMKK